MLAIVLIVLILLACGGSGYYGNRAGLFGARPGFGYGGVSLIGFLLIMLVVFMLADSRPVAPLVGP